MKFFWFSFAIWVVRLLAELGREFFRHIGRYEGFQIPIELSDFLDRVAGQVTVLIGRHEEHAVDVAGKRSVGVRHLELVLEVGDGAQAADNVVGTEFLALVNGQIGAAFDRAPATTIAHYLAHHVDPFGSREKAVFVGIDGDQDDQFVEHLERAFGDVDVTVGDRIETTGIHCDFHVIRPISCTIRRCCRMLWSYT